MITYVYIAAPKRVPSSPHSLSLSPFQDPVFFLFLFPLGGRGGEGSRIFWEGSFHPPPQSSPSPNWMKPWHVILENISMHIKTFVVTY